MGFRTRVYLKPPQDIANKPRSRYCSHPASMGSAPEGRNWHDDRFCRSVVRFSDRRHRDLRRGYYMARSNGPNVTLSIERAIYIRHCWWVYRAISWSLPHVFSADVVADVLLVLVPMTKLWNLRLPPNQRFLLLTVFGASFCTLLAAINFFIFSYTPLNSGPSRLLLVLMVAHIEVRDIFSFFLTQHLNRSPRLPFPSSSVTVRS